jgi:glycosyltransferase involved in cell wall biosynthesis
VDKITQRLPKINKENEVLKDHFFSVIIPTYNSEKYIERSVKSISKGSFYNFEIIIIDDGSCDNTKIVCSDMAKNDHRISYIYQKNSGPNVARNNGIEHAKGEYIIFLDADDEILPGALDVLYRELASDFFDFINFGISFANGETNKITTKISCDRNILKNSEIINAAMTGGAILSVCWSKAINREFLIKNNIRFFPDKTHGRDIIFSRILAFRAKKSLVIPNVLVRSYEIDDSFSRSFSIDNVKSSIKVSHDTRIFFENGNFDKNIMSYAIYKHLRYVLVVSSFRFKESSSYIFSINLVKDEFPDLIKFKNCKKLKDCLFVMWLKFSNISFLTASLLKIFNIRPY